MEYRTGPTELPEKKAVTAALVTDRIYHGQFETIMKPAVYTDFVDFLTELSMARGEGSVGELAIQFFVSETPKEFEKAEDIHWVAVVFDTLQEEACTSLEAKGIIVPNDSRDLSECAVINEAACFSLSWSDIAWGQFNHRADAHENITSS